MSGQVRQSRPGTFLHRLRARPFRISPDQACFEVREFHACAPLLREHLEKIGRTFLEGYHAALDDQPIGDLAARLREGDIAFEGFAFEGAAMGLSLLDRFSLGAWGRRFRQFVHGPGARHMYMIHVGFGWMLARIPWGMRRAVGRLDPLLGWLAVDGYGFHEGFFRFPQYAGGRKQPRISEGYWLRAFDQGLGRSLWFVMGASAAMIADAIEAFEPSRRADLWSGAGLAATYAGGCDERNLLALRALASDYLPQVAQGAAFAAKARLRAGNPTEQTHLGCEVLCGMSPSEAAALTDAAMEQLPPDGLVPAYEIWRMRVQKRIGTEMGVVN